MLKTLETLGSLRKRTSFAYTGSIHADVVLLQSSSPRIDATFFRHALQHFAGRTVYGGFKEDGPPPDSFGEWVEQQSEKLNSRKLTPRHGSFMAAILCHEAGVRNSLESNRRVVLKFPAL